MRLCNDVVARMTCAEDRPGGVAVATPFLQRNAQERCVVALVLALPNPACLLGMHAGLTLGNTPMPCIDACLVLVDIAGCRMRYLYA